MRTKVCLAAALLVSPSLGAQTNPYVGAASVGKVVKTDSMASIGPGTLEVKDWVGQRFILLPQPSSLRSYGYQLFQPPLPYDQWAGKILTVTAVSADGPLSVVSFKTDGNAEISARVFSGNVKDLAPIRDIDYARARWLGKSLWLRVSEVITYDETTDKYGGVRVGRTAHVVVKNIVVGSFDHEPIRFILTTDDGREGFLDVQLSGTNVAEILRNPTSFAETFSETDPRLQHKDWPARVWTAIAQEKVFIGMTADQAETSWGKPRKINRTTVQGAATAQWIYGDSTYLYVRNGVVTAVQN